MAKYIVTLAADSASTHVCDIHKPRGLKNWFATVAAYSSGNTGSTGFGGGTLAWFWSPDNGTTKIPLNDITGNAISQTVAGGFNTEFGSGNKLDDAIKIYVSLTGSTSPTITVAVFDNRE